MTRTTVTMTVVLLVGILVGGVSAELRGIEGVVSCMLGVLVSVGLIACVLR